MGPTNVRITGRGMRRGHKIATRLALLDFLSAPGLQMNSSRSDGSPGFSPLDTPGPEKKAERVVRAQKLRSFVSAAICNSAYNNNYSFESVASPTGSDCSSPLPPLFPIFCFATLKLSRPLRDFVPLLPRRGRNT